MNKKTKIVLLTGTYTIVSVAAFIASYFGNQNTAHALSSGQTIVRNEEVKMEEDGDGSYTAPPGTEQLLIKQGPDQVVVWSEEPITDINQFRSDYLATPGRDPSIKDDSQFIPISGLGDHDVHATLGNPWGSYNVSKDPTTGQYVLTTDPSKISHLNCIVNGTPTPTIPVGTPTVPVGTPTPTIPVGTPTVPVGTPTPTLPGGTPTVPVGTPTPTLPGGTPTPFDPNNTPGPTPSEEVYPKTGPSDEENIKLILAGTGTGLFVGGVLYIILKKSPMEALFEDVGRGAYSKGRGRKH